MHTPSALKPLENILTMERRKTRSQSQSQSKSKSVAVLSQSQSQENEEEENENVPINTFHGFHSDMPVPFVGGQPVSYNTMTVDQLRRFIPFVYKSAYKKELPDQEQGGREQPPKWWPEAVSFDKELRVIGPKLERQKVLVTLVRQFYGAFGTMCFLAIGCELSQPPNPRHKYRVDEDGRNTLRITDHGRLIAVVDVKTRTYDSPNGTIPKVLSFGKKENGIRATKRARNGLPKPKPLNLRSNGLPKSLPKTRAAKRKFLEKQDCEPAYCDHCGKQFRYKEFCLDHAETCPKKPPTQLTQEGFMAALGLVGSSQAPDLKKPPTILPIQRTATRNLRPRRTQLLSMIRNHPMLPLTSARGQMFLKAHDENHEHSNPPPYEKYCKPKSNSRLPPEPDFPCVTKKVITKTGEDPHIYSYKNSQRVIRYQELVIGVSEASWEKLNKCRKPKLLVPKLQVPPGMTRFIIPDAQLNLLKNSHVEHSLQGALQLPFVRLVDFGPRLTEEQRRFLRMNN